MKDSQLLLRELESAYANKLPFVAYREPNHEVVKAMVQNSDEIHSIASIGEPGFVFAPFNSAEKNILIPFNDSKFIKAHFIETPVSSENEQLYVANSGDKAKHLTLVNATLNFIKKGFAKKVVISRKEIVEFPEFSFATTFERLVHTYKNAFVYVWYHPTIGLWLGATPELLITIKDNLFETVSLAGTQPYTKTLDITWGLKELEEQQIVTDYIQSQLKPLVDTLSISKIKTVKAGNLIHLSTGIKGYLKNAKNIDGLLKLLHPTPAVCGLPKEASKRFILEKEGYPREFYAGFLGEVHVENKTNLYVNLRCMKYKVPNIELFLGGGITKDSIAENEWHETVEKAKVIKKVL